MTFSQIMSYFWDISYQGLNISIPLGQYRPTLWELSIGFLFFTIILKFIFGFIRGKGD